MNPRLSPHQMTGSLSSIKARISAPTRFPNQLQLQVPSRPPARSSWRNRSSQRPKKNSSPPSSSGRRPGVVVARLLFPPPETVPGADHDRNSDQRDSEAIVSRSRRDTVRRARNRTRLSFLLLHHRLLLPAGLQEIPRPFPPDDRDQVQSLNAATTRRHRRPMTADSHPVALAHDQGHCFRGGIIMHSVTVLTDGFTHPTRPIPPHYVRVPVRSPRARPHTLPHPAAAPSRFMRARSPAPPAAGARMYSGSRLAPQTPFTCSSPPAAHVHAITQVLARAPQPAPTPHGLPTTRAMSSTSPPPGNRLPRPTCTSSPRAQPRDRRRARLPRCLPLADPLLQRQFFAAPPARPASAAGRSIPSPSARPA